MSSISSQIGNAALKTTMQLAMIASFASLVASKVLYTNDPSQSTNYNLLLNKTNGSVIDNNIESSSFFDNLFNGEYNPHIFLTSFFDNLLNGEYNPHIRKSQAILGLVGAIVSSGALIPQIWHNYKTKSAPFKPTTLYLFISGGILGTIATASITDVNNYLLWVANATNIISTVERVTLLIQNLMYSKEGNKQDLSPKEFSLDLNEFLKIFTKNNKNECDEIIDIEDLVKQISEKNKDLFNNDELTNNILEKLNLNKDDTNRQKIFQAFEDSKLAENIDQNVKKVLEEFKINIENNLKNTEKYIVDLNKEIKDKQKHLENLQKQNKKNLCNKYFDKNLKNQIKDKEKELNKLKEMKQEINNGFEALSKLGGFFKNQKPNQFQQELNDETAALSTNIYTNNIVKFNDNNQKANDSFTKPAFNRQISYIQK